MQGVGTQKVCGNVKKDVYDTRGYVCPNYSMCFKYQLIWHLCDLVWTLHTSKNIDLIELVQCRATQWIKSSFDPNGPNLMMSVSESLDGLLWSCGVIMCVLSCSMLTTPINFSDYFQLNDLPTHSASTDSLPSTLFH